MNAPAIAEARGLTVRETKRRHARDYVNLVELRGPTKAGPPTSPARSSASRPSPRIVGIDDHIVDVPPSAHMLVVRNDDVPGVIGTVGSILGDAKVNIDDMVVGRTSSGAAALMVLSTSAAVDAAVIDTLRAADGILDARAIDFE